MGQMAIMDRTGDTKLVWDQADDVSMQIAKASFDAAKKKGYLAYSVNKKGDKGTQVKEFDPSAESLILAPALVGG